jgi:hypothetical protein
MNEREPRRAKPRHRGRPRQDRRDQLTVDLAAVLRALFQNLGPQQARDLALALREGKPSHSQRPDGVAVLSFRLPNTVKGRSDALQRKGKKPRDILVRAVISALLPPGHIFTGCKRS